MIVYYYYCCAFVRARIMYRSTVLASEKKATRCPRALPQQHSNLGFHKETGSRREGAASGLPHQACGWASRGTSDAAVGFHFGGRKNSAKMFVRSGEIPSPGQTSNDQNNDCAMKSERGTPVRGSDPPSGHSVYQTTGDRWRAPARHLTQTYLGAAV